MSVSRLSRRGSVIACVQRPAETRDLIRGGSKQQPVVANGQERERPKSGGQDSVHSAAERHEQLGMHPCIHACTEVYVIWVHGAQVELRGGSGLVARSLAAGWRRHQSGGRPRIASYNNQHVLILTLPSFSSFLFPHHPISSSSFLFFSPLPLPAPIPSLSSSPLTSLSLTHPVGTHFALTALPPALLRLPHRSSSSQRSLPVSVRAHATSYLHEPDDIRHAKHHAQPP